MHGTLITYEWAFQTSDLELMAEWDFLKKSTIFLPRSLPGFEDDDVIKDGHLEVDVMRWCDENTGRPWTGAIDETARYEFAPSGLATMTATYNLILKFENTKDAAAAMLRFGGQTLEKTDAVH